jgi:hypothetical protein
MRHYQHRYGVKIMLRKKLLWIVLATSLAGTVMAGTPIIDQREKNQSQRIAQGVRSGELNRAETKRLVNGQRRLHASERRAKADGVVTARERVQLNRQAQVQSQRINRQKHDEQTRR